MTEPLKPWQHGYTLDTLLDYEARYTTYNSYMASPFAAFKKHRIAERLHANEFVVGEGYAYVITTAKVRTALSQFPDVAFGERFAGDRTLSYLAVDWNDGRWQQEFARLCTAPSPLWIQVPVRDTEAITHISRVATRAGTKITTFGDIFAWFVRESEKDAGLFGSSRLRTVEPVHQYGICPCEVDVEAHARALYSDVAALSVPYQDHYSNYNADHAWGALSVRGYSADVHMIAKPSEMNAKWKAAHAHEDFTLQDTTLRAQLPSLEPLLHAFGDVTWHRIRLMRLQPGGGELQRHTDQVDADSGFGVGQLMRIHVPLKTNPQVIFTVWDANDVAQEVHMPAFSAYALDTRWPHRAINGGRDERIHLVMDAVTTPALQARLRP